MGQLEMERFRVFTEYWNIDRAGTSALTLAPLVTEGEKLIRRDSRCVLQRAGWQPYLAADADMLDLCQRDTQAGLPGDTLLIP